MDAGYEVTDTTGTMVDFFRKLADDLESHKMSPSDIAKAGHMYLYWKWKTDPYSATNSDEDIEKYMFTGWYIYQNYNSINSNPNDDL